MSERDINCKGCLNEIKDICLLRPNYIDEQGNKIECPCQTCLIKGICIKECDELHVYFSRVVRQR